MSKFRSGPFASQRKIVSIRLLLLVLFFWTNSTVLAAPPGDRYQCPLILIGKYAGAEIEVGKPPTALYSLCEILKGTPEYGEVRITYDVPNKENLSAEKYAKTAESMLPAIKSKWILFVADTEKRHYRTFKSSAGRLELNKQNLVDTLAGVEKVTGKYSNARRAELLNYVEPGHIDWSQTYFPHDLNEFVQEWYAQQLRAMHEAPLWNQPNAANKYSFRFTWLRTFHQPICVRLEQSKDGNVTLFGKKASGAGGYSPGKIITDEHKVLTSQAFDSFKSELTKLDFFNIPAEHKSEGCDGAQWIFEINDHGKYHVVDRWCPQEAPIRELGIDLLKKAELLPTSSVY